MTKHYKTTDIRPVLITGSVTVPLIQTASSEVIQIRPAGASLPIVSPHADDLDHLVPVKFPAPAA